MYITFFLEHCNFPHTYYTPIMSIKRWSPTEWYPVQWLPRKITVHIILHLMKNHQRGEIWKQIKIDVYSSKLKTICQF
jgi:hypothetical protein